MKLDQVNDPVSWGRLRLMFCLLDRCTCQVCAKGGGGVDPFLTPLPRAICLHLHLPLTWCHTTTTSTPVKPPPSWLTIFENYS